MKDPRRNKLGHEDANKLVALFHNLWHISRMKGQPTVYEPAVGWNNEELKVGVVSYGVNNYDGAAKLNAPQSKKLPHKRPTVLHDGVLTPPQSERDSEPKMWDFDM